VDFNSYDSALDNTDYLGLALEPVDVLGGVLVEVLAEVLVDVELCCFPLKGLLETGFQAYLNLSTMFIFGADTLAAL
jgi:hypothetical protein